MMLNNGLECTAVYLLLGGNLGNRERNLQEAIKLINDLIGEVFTVSSLYETAAWGKTDQPAFINQAIGVRTQLSAMAVLEAALAIEKQLGRIRKVKWGERLIDIDIILFGDEIIDNGITLQVPHPQMQNRRFVMEPLAEIAPKVMHPILGKTILEISENVTDNLEVKRI